LATADKTPGTIERWLAAATRFAHLRPWVVLAIAAAILAVSWGTASRLTIRSNFVELLPSESETAKRFQTTLDRKGGGSSTLMVMVASPDADANHKIVDALEAKIAPLPPTMIKSVEHGPEDARAFYQRWRWLFAERRDLMIIACEVHRERMRRLGQYLDLDDPCEEEVDEELAETRDPVEQKRRGLTPPAGTEPPPASPDAPAAHSGSDEKLSPLTRLKRELDAREAELDRYPTGYFRNDDGTLYALVVRAPAKGLGGVSADELLARLEAIAAEVDAKAFHPEAEIGFGGDIPNAIAERDALIEDMTIVSVVAISLILGVIVLFFRSAWPLIHIGIAVGTGCGLAFGAAALVIGHLNAATSFLGSIIAGNGINDSIVYLGRYRERRAAGDEVGEALLEAARSTRKGTWLASVAASGAYGALMITSFRGFSEFGLIGAVGMVSCWFATFGFCPATVTVVERIRRRRTAPEKAVRSTLVRFIAKSAVRWSPAVLVLGVGFSALAMWPLPTYLADPWEYDFSRLRSQRSTDTGAGHWSRRAGEIFKEGRGAPDLVLAPDMDSALAIARRIVERDETLTGGRFVERVEIIHDRLGGPPALVEAKLEVLGEIREELDGVKHRLQGEDAEFADRWRPPERLRVLTPDDLPPLVREMFVEVDGRVGTAIFVYFNRTISKSQGANLLVMADILESVTLDDGTVVPNASNATVFAEMIRSMERDGPRATLAAFLVVVLVSLLVTRSTRGAVAVIGSLVLGVIFTVGGAAWLGVRLNFLNFVALPLTFGIGVEYAINLYDRIRVCGGDVVEGIGSAGGAVFLCSLTTIFGYGSLLWADNLALQSFGKYAVAGEVACIVTGLVVLPAALSLRRRAKKTA
jgi:uncharacterized protein